MSKNLRKPMESVRLCVCVCVWSEIPTQDFPVTQQDVQCSVSIELQCSYTFLSNRTSRKVFRTSQQCTDVFCLP